MKRRLDILVLSDLHLGTANCQAEDLMDYLRSVKPQMVVLNGDVFDLRTRKHLFFPQGHLRVLRHLAKWSMKVPVYCIAGNHDRALRRLGPLHLGNIHLLDKFALRLNGCMHWFTHGDVFDGAGTWSRSVLRIGGPGYGLSLALARWKDLGRWILGAPRGSLSEALRRQRAGGARTLDRFERTMAGIAADQGYCAVLCGHTHHPGIRKIRVGQHTVTYMNSGDWVGHGTALEHAHGEWRLYRHAETQENEDQLIEATMRLEVDRSLRSFPV